MRELQKSVQNRGYGALPKPNAAVVVLATGEVGVVLGNGRDKETGEELVCVELPGKLGAGRWGFYPPTGLATI